MDTSNPGAVGRNLQDFVLQDQYYPGRPTNAFGAVFANRGESVIFGSMGEKTLIWDKRSGKVTHELDHGDGEILHFTILTKRLQLTHPTLDTIVQALAVRIVSLLEYGFLLTSFIPSFYRVSRESEVKSIL